MKRSTFAKALRPELRSRKPKPALSSFPPAPMVASAVQAQCDREKSGGLAQLRPRPAPTSARGAAGSQPLASDDIFSPAHRCCLTAQRKQCTMYNSCCLLLLPLVGVPQEGRRRRGVGHQAVRRRLHARPLPPPHKRLLHRSRLQHRCGDEMPALALGWHRRGGCRPQGTLLGTGDHSL